jgi:phage gp29-like protein
MANKSQIVDATGRPFEYLDEEQTKVDPNIALVAARTQTHPISGVTPDRAAQYLRAAEQGNLTAQADMAEDMEEKDTHLQSELGKRRRAVQAVDWMLQPPRNASAQEKRDTEALQEILEDANWWEDVIFDATDAILKGYSAQEIRWEYVEKMHVPRSIEFRDPGIFQLNPNNRNELMLRDGSYTGKAPNVFGWIIHRAKSKSGYLSRIGLVRTLVWPFIFKNYSVRDMAEFLEIYGLPIRLGKYPSGASEKEKATLLRAVMSIGHNAGGVIPRGMDIEFNNAADGQSDPFVAMMDWAEKSMSKAILGGTLTSQADGKSSTNALGEIHDEVRTEVRDSDLKQLAITLNRDLIYPMYALNFPSYRGPLRQPQLVFDTREPEDIKTYADSLPKLAPFMNIPARWAHEKMGIPEPQPGDLVISSEGEVPFEKPVPKDEKPLSKDPAALAANNPELDDLDDMAASVTGEQWSAVMQPVLQPVIDAIQTDGPEAAMKKAAELFPQMDDSQLIKLLRGAIFAADVYGRLENVEE